MQADIALSLPLLAVKVCTLSGRLTEDVGLAQLALMHEASMHVRLEHPNIVALYIMFVVSGLTGC